MSRTALLLVLLVAAALVVPARAESPRVLESGPLRFHHAPEHARVVAELERTAHAELIRVSRALGLPVPERVEIFVLPRKGRFDPEEWGLPAGPRWAAGLALEGEPIIVLRTVEETGPIGSPVHQTLVHELVHVTTSQGLGARVGELPTWFKEGTARMLAREWTAFDTAQALRQAFGGEPTPFVLLSDSFPHDPDRASDAYRQSRAFVSWLDESGGGFGLQAVHSRVARGEPFDEAFIAAFGQTPLVAEARWRRHYMRWHRWVPLVTSASTPWLVVILLAALGWARKRRRAKERLAELEAEDQALLEAAAAAAAGEGEPSEADDVLAEDRP